MAAIPVNEVFKHECVHVLKVEQFLPDNITFVMESNDFSNQYDEKGAHLRLCISLDTSKQMRELSKILYYVSDYKDTFGHKK